MTTAKSHIPYLAFMKPSRFFGRFYMTVTMLLLVSFVGAEMNQIEGFELNFYQWFWRALFLTSGALWVVLVSTAIVYRFQHSQDYALLAGDVFFCILSGFIFSTQFTTKLADKTFYISNIHIQGEPISGPDQALPEMRMFSDFYLSQLAILSLMIVAMIFGIWVAKRTITESNA